MLFSSINEEGAREIRKVNLTHQNHNPTPGKTRYISKYRREEVNCAVRQKLFNDSVLGFPNYIVALRRKGMGLKICLSQNGICVVLRRNGS